MNNQVKVVNPQDFGIEEKQANDLFGDLPLILEERMPLIADFQSIKDMDINDPQAAKLARASRLAIRDNRTKKIEVWRKTTKDWFLRGGQFIDATAKIYIEQNCTMEEQLEAIEKHAENQERIRLDALEQTRLQTLEPFKEFVPFGANIRNISDDDFQKLLNGSKLQFDAKVAADKAAEEARLEAERIERERIENERKIKALHEERKQSALPYFQFWSEFEKTLNFGTVSENDFNNFMTRIKGEKAEHDKQIEAQRIENERLKKEADKIEKEREAERQKAKAAQQKIQDELDAKNKAEAQAKQAQEAAELAAQKEAEKLAKAPIKKQIAAWIEAMELPNIELNNELVQDMKARFVQYKEWCQKLNNQN